MCVLVSSSFTEKGSDTFDLIKCPLPKFCAILKKIKVSVEASNTVNPATSQSRTFDLWVHTVWNIIFIFLLIEYLCRNVNWVALLDFIRSLLCKTSGHWTLPNPFQILFSKLSNFFLNRYKKIEESTLPIAIIVFW